MTEQKSETTRTLSYRAALREALIEEMERDERVFMMGVPIGLLVKLPFLPFLYLARGTMMASERKLVRTLS